MPTGSPPKFSSFALAEKAGRGPCGDQRRVLGLAALYSCLPAPFSIPNSPDTETFSSKNEYFLPTKRSRRAQESGQTRQLSPFDP